MVLHSDILFSVAVVYYNALPAAVISAATHFYLPTLSARRMEPPLGIEPGTTSVVSGLSLGNETQTLPLYNSVDSDYHAPAPFSLPCQTDLLLRHFFTQPLDSCGSERLTD